MSGEILWDISKSKEQIAVMTLSEDDMYGVWMPTKLCRCHSDIEHAHSDLIDNFDTVTIIQGIDIHKLCDEDVVQAIETIEDNRQIDPRAFAAVVCDDITHNNDSNNVFGLYRVKVINRLELLE